MMAVVTADRVIAVSGCCSQDHEQCSPKEYAELGEHMVVGDAEGADQQDHIGTRQADSSLQEHEAEQEILEAVHGQCPQRRENWDSYAVPV